MNTRNLSRRDFLRISGLGVFALLGSRLDVFPSAPSPFRSIQSRMNTPAFQMEPEPFVPDAEVSITAAE